MRLHGVPASNSPRLFALMAQCRELFQRPSPSQAVQVRSPVDFDVLITGIGSHRDAMHWSRGA
eukprot:3708057-Pyramimonas_sp.AAC.1